MKGTVERRASWMDGIAVDRKSSEAVITVKRK